MNNKTITLIEYEYLHYNENDNEKTKLSLKEFNAVKEFIYRNEETNATQFLKITTRNKHEALEAQQFVGIIQLTNGKTIEILPKISKEKNVEKSKEILIKMLKTLKNFPFKNFQSVNLKTTKMPLFEIFIQMFLVELWKVVKKGVKHNYITIEENAKFLKGKLIFPQHIKKNFAHRERFFISYDNYLPNRIENRIIKTTLKFLYKLSSETANKKMIRSLLFIFDEITPITNNIKNAFSKIKLDRTIDYYQTVLMWCKVFLLHENFTPYKGKDIAFALLFDMNRLFESYVGKWFKDNCKNFVVSLQESKHYLIDKPRKFHLRPDIVLRDNDKVIVLDTKWKVIKEEREIADEDIYQMFAYASKYNNEYEKCEEIYLIYPAIEEKRDFQNFEFKICKNNVKLGIRFFDVIKKIKKINP